MVATVCIAVMSRPVGAAGGKDGEKSARNNRQAVTWHYGSAK